MNIASLHQLFLSHPSVTTDTRKIETGSIFFALKGDTFNGNEFAEDALKKGAAYAVIDEEKYLKNEKTILVGNALQTLQELAKYHRQFLNIPILGLTGSNGKTTTKELIYAVLSKKYRSIATAGNFNNHIGVPLTLLRMNKETEFGIVEMGANHQKEIAFLSSIALPDYGCITNFGKAHLEGFGGIEGVIKGKSELYDSLISREKTVFYNTDDAIQKEKLNHYNKRFGYGKQEAQVDVYIEAADANPFAEISVQGVSIKSQLIGSYNIQNIALATTVGLFFEIPLKSIQKSIAAYIPSNNRSQLLKRGSNQIILDAYNANPTSMEAALKNLELIDATKKVAYLGDMFELGTDAAAEHQKIAELAEKLTDTTVYLIGENFSKTNSSLKTFTSFEDARQFIKGNQPHKATLLIKGSRGMALERILELI